MRFLFLFLICIVLSPRSSAQEKLRFKTSGGFTGYGYQLNPGIDYKVYYLAGEFSFPLGKKEKKNFFSWYLEPQVNLVKTGRTDFEIGSNIGIRYNIRLSEGFYFFPLIGSGPHYYSAKVERQAPGFLFSDNFALGLMKRTGKNSNTMLSLQLRYRHMSNASTRQPNSGIDHLNFLIGLSKVR